MSDAHQQIYQMHLIFMTQLAQIKGKIPDDDYYALEGQYKSLAQLADSLADEAVKAKTPRSTIRVDPELWKDRAPRHNAASKDETREVYISGLTPQEQAAKMKHDREAFNPK